MISTAPDHGIAPHIVQDHARYRSIASALDYGETGQALMRHPGVGLGAGEQRSSDDRLARDLIQEEPSEGSPVPGATPDG